MTASQNFKNKIVAETILIEFQVEDGQLVSAIDLLEKTGQIDTKLANGFRQTTAEINKQAQAIKSDAAATAPLKKNLEDVNRATKSMTQEFMEGFEEGVIDTLKEAGVSVKEFTDALTTGQTEVTGASESLRQRLKNLTQQIAELKIKGEDNSEQFHAMIKEAGEIKDAIGDAAAEINNLASDTGTFDGLISAMQGVTGAFAIGQGVVGLFGDESEELQKTLLRVNSVMAVAQGLQQVQNVLQKESAASRLLDTVAAKAQIVVQRIYTAVTGQATAATVAFKVALASTGVLLLVVGVLALIQALKDEDDALEDVNAELERNKNFIDADIKAIERRTEIAVAQAQKAGKAESDLTKIRGQGLLAQRQAILDANKDLARQRDALDNTSDAYFELNKRIEENAESISDIDQQLIIQNLNFQKQLADEAKKAAEEAKKLAEERAAKAREARLRELNDQLAALERQLLIVEEGSHEELRIKQRIVAQKARIELEGENLTVNQKKLIQERAAQDQLNLERDRNKQLTAEAIAGQISLNNAVLAQIQTSNEDRLLLQISNLELMAAAEIAAAENNSVRIKEIIAKRDADILAVRKANIELEAQQEIDLLTAREGANNRALQRIAQDEKRTALERITAIQQVAGFELGIIERREQVLKEELNKRLISDQEYNLRYAQLQDEKLKLSEDTEKRISDIHDDENKKRGDQIKEFVLLVIETTQQVLDVIGQINELRAQQDQQRIDEERARVQELLETGAITEKEAIARNKRIDAEEKKLKREAAQRDKALAIFNAILNTAAAVTKALPNLVLAGIAAALGAAQVAIIAARPIPKFKTGKKNSYEGPGIIGEDGAEIFEHDGKRYIAHKETLVWLGKDDKVYTPQETKMMLPQVDVKAIQPQQGDTVKVEPIDYDELGRAVGRHVKVPGLKVDEEGFKVWQEDAVSRTAYRNKYYSSK